MITATIDRGASWYQGDVECDGEITIHVEGEVGPDGAITVTRAYQEYWHYWKNADVEEDVELDEREEKRAIEALEREATK